MALEIIETGPLTTIQDGGRIGYGKYGYRRCGACDKYAMRLANILAGNEDDRAAVLEFTLSGGKIRFTEDTVIAVTGGDMSSALDGIPFAMYQPKVVRAGQTLTLGFARTGLRTYLAVCGGLCTPDVMGSCSTDTACGIGGLKGRALASGDVIATGLQHYMEDLQDREEEFALTADQFWLKQPSYPYRSVGSQLVPVMRVVPGPQENAFTKEGREQLWRGVYQVSADSNRMACRLQGPVLETKKGSDIISDGIVEGSIQVASGGQPIVMLADHQTTGGYAKIGTVISSDLSAIAQRRPGESIGFQYITAQEAAEAYRKEERKLEWLKKEIFTKRNARRQ